MLRGGPDSPHHCRYSSVALQHHDFTTDPTPRVGDRQELRWNRRASNSQPPRQRLPPPYARERPDLEPTNLYNLLVGSDSQCQQSLRRLHRSVGRTEHVGVSRMPDCRTIRGRPTHGAERSSWSAVPDTISCCLPRLFRTLRSAVANVQSRGHVCGLEWSLECSGSSESLVRFRRISSCRSS